MNFTGSVTLLRVVLVGPLALAILGCFMVVENASGRRSDAPFSPVAIAMIFCSPS